MTSIAKQSNFTFTFFASTMQWPKAIKHLNKKYVFLLEQIEHGNREEKRVGRQKMKAAITSSEHVSLVGREKWTTCHKHLHIVHLLTFLLLGSKIRFYVIMIMYC